MEGYDANKMSDNVYTQIVGLECVALCNGMCPRS